MSKHETRQKGPGDDPEDFTVAVKEEKPKKKAPEKKKGS